MKIVELHIPDEVDLKDYDFLMIIASKLYEDGKLSAGQAAEMAGLTKLAKEKDSPLLLLDDLKARKDHKPTKTERGKFLSSMNSYLGIMNHYKSYSLRKDMIFKLLSVWWWNWVFLKGGIAKFVMKTEHK